jgi:hypothetical protein
MNPNDLPAVTKKKQKLKSEVQSGKLVFNEEDRQKRPRPHSDEEAEVVPKPSKKQRPGYDGVIVTLHPSDSQSKHARGDMKKPGRPDPFAYIQFNPSMLNKRKRMKVAAKLDSLVNTAKRGVFKGLKARKRGV